MGKNILEYLTNLWYSIIRIDDNRVVYMMKGKMKIEDIADCFLRIVDRDSGSTITPLKLQKILYYAQGYYLAMYDMPLFNEDFQAWAHGPVNPKIYNNYKEYGYDSINYPSGKAPRIKDDILDFLYKIWDTFGIYDGKYLEGLTHKEEPWISARERARCSSGDNCNEIITKESMRQFFKTKIS